MGSERRVGQGGTETRTLEGKKSRSAPRQWLTVIMRAEIG